MFKNITDKFTKFICKKDAKNLVSLFSDNGVYHDYIYGNFKGKNNIKLMLTEYFYRDAENFYWQMYDHVFKENMGYAKYRFAFISKVPEFLGKKVVISGMSFFKFKEELIIEYSESVNGGLAMVQLGVNSSKMEKVFLKWYKRSLEDDPNLNSLNERLSK